MADKKSAFCILGILESGVPSKVLRRKTSSPVFSNYGFHTSVDGEINSVSSYQHFFKKKGKEKKKRI